MESTRRKVNQVPNVPCGPMPCSCLRLGLGLCKVGNIHPLNREILMKGLSTHIFPGHGAHAAHPASPQPSASPQETRVPWGQGHSALKERLTLAFLSLMSGTSEHVVSL